MIWASFTICPSHHRGWYLNKDWVMQKDNDPKHRCKSTTEWIMNSQIHFLLEWPSQSPNLHPTKMLWTGVKRAIQIRLFTNVSEMKQFWERSKIPPECCAALIQ